MRALYHHRTQGRDVEAVHIHGVCEGLSELGFEVEVLGPPGVDTDPNSRRSPLTRKEATPLGRLARTLPQFLFEGLEIGYNLVAIPRLLARCIRKRPALIYERYALYNTAAVVVGKLTGIPTILEVNETAGVDRTRQGKKLALPALARWFERRILNGAAGIAVVSGYLKDYVENSGVSGDRVRVTPNAVDTNRFDPETVDQNEIRERYGLTGKTVIGFAGSFTKWHGVDLLLRAAAAIAAEFPELALLLVGDGARREASEELARELGITDRVVFTGKVPHQEMPALVAAMNLGVMPASNLYGSPMKVFEYMAMGRPAVGPRYRPLEEAIDPEENGLLFEPDNLADLTGCLRSLVADAEYRSRLGRAARMKVLAQHRWVHNAQAVVEMAGASQVRMPVGSAAEAGGAG